MSVRCILIFLFATHYPISLNAQQHLSIVDENAVWIERRQNSDGYNPDSNVLSEYKFKGDTIISDTIYKKLYQNKTYQGGIREEEKKVFLRTWNYQEKRTKERIIYDFSLNKGDTLTLQCSQNNGCKKLLVLEVDTIFFLMTYACTKEGLNVWPNRH